MTYVVIIVYCVLVVMFLLGVTFYQEFHNEKLRKTKCDAGRTLLRVRH